MTQNDRCAQEDLAVQPSRSELSEKRHAYFIILEYLTKLYLYRKILRDSPLATRNHVFQPRTAFNYGRAVNSEFWISLRFNDYTDLDFVKIRG
jgi:hypothetical protein